MVLLVLLCACTGRREPLLPYYNTPDFTPHLFTDRDKAASIITHLIPSFSLRDEDGNTVSQKDVRGKIHVADFIFTTCGSICPKMTDQMKRVGEAFRNDTSVVILSYSVTPWIDTPAKLRKYREEKGITKKDWHFLTGDKASIYSLARKGYFAEEDLGFTKDSSQFLHTEHFILVDAGQRIRGIYNGTLQLEAEQLIKDIKALQKEMQ